MDAQLVEWIVEYQDQILDDYVVWRKERGDTRPDEAMRHTVVLSVGVMMQIWQSAEGPDFVQAVEAAIQNAIASDTPMDVIVESFQGLFAAVRQVMHKEQPPQQIEWLGRLGDIMLGSSQVIAKVLRANFERQKARWEGMYEISRGLGAASDEDELLQIVSLPAREAGASEANLLYIDLDKTGQPEWAEIVASWRREGTPSIPVGSRFYLPEFPFSGIWLTDLDAVQVIGDTHTDERLDANSRSMIVQSGARAIAIVPLAHAGRWVGVIAFNWSEAREFAEHEIGVYNALVGLVASAVENRRLVDTLEQRVRQRTHDLATFQAIIENTPDAIGMVNLDGSMIYANPSFCEMFGYDVYDELMDSTLLDIYADPPELILELFQKVQEEGDWQGVLTNRRKDGSTFAGQISALALYGNDEKPWAVAGSIRDISERQQAEAEREWLLSQLSRLTAVMDSTSDFVSTSDLQGGILYVNPAGMEMVGYAGRDFTSMTVADFHTPEMSEKIGREYIPTAIERGTWSGETTLRHADGTIIPTSQVIIPIRDQDGELEALGTIVRDIRDLKQAEAERERLQQNVIEAQKQALQELSTPIIPIVNTARGSIIVMPLIGAVDSTRAKDITRALLAGISEHRAKVVILDITGVPIVDSSVAGHLNKTIQAARLKGASTIVTGVSDGVAETIVDMGIDWSGINTLNDLQTGLIVALGSLGIKLSG
jgi:PAS domain S-box-containing protein